MLYPTELQAHYLRSKIIGESRLEELVGAVGFEPTTPWSQTRCATKLRHAPIHLSFCTVQRIVRYGVHSRRDARLRQHLYSKKVKKTLHMYIYQAFQRFFIQFQRFNAALKSNIRSNGNFARSASAGSTNIS